MELPHLTLYLRRFKAPVPTRSGWHAVWEAPRIRWWLSALAWLTLCLAYVYAHRLPAFDGSSLDSALGSPIAFASNVAIYLTLTMAMSSLAGEASPSSRHWLRAQEPPAWYSSRLSSSQAVLGMLLGALLQVLPVALCSMGLLFIWFYYQQAPEWSQFLLGNLQSLLRLPLLALAAASLTLALRGTIFQPFAPIALTAAAVIAAEADGSFWQSQLGVILRDPFGPDPSISFITIVGGTMLLMLGSNVLLRRLSHVSSGGLFPVVLLVGLCGLSGVIGIFGVIDAYTGLGLSAFFTAPLFTVLHSFSSSFLPDLGAFTISSEGSSYTSLMFHQPPPPPAVTYHLQYYGWDFPLTVGIPLAAAFYLAALAFWFWTAVQCLDAARGRGARLSPLQQWRASRAATQTGTPI